MKCDDCKYCIQRHIDDKGVMRNQCQNDPNVKGILAHLFSYYSLNDWHCISLYEPERCHINIIRPAGEWSPK